MNDIADTRTDNRRIILVTGASRGLGHSVARHLADQNTHIIALARSIGALETLDDQIRQNGGSATLLPLDLNDHSAIDALAHTLLNRFARLDGLFAAAGVSGTPGPLQSVSPSAFQNILDVNLFANWHLIRSLDPLLRAAPHGRAVFVTDSAALHRRAYNGVYSASKAALEAMVIAYANETRHSRMRINLLDPGPMRTAMRTLTMPGENPAILPHPDDIAHQAIAALSPSWKLHGQRMTPQTQNRSEND